jgi:glycosyltransferase involved in cell wall biosynthesis
MTTADSNLAPAATPLVSVAITSFNSAQWLPRALESVLKQRTEYPIEIVIGDDCSQDATINVAQSYREKYPHIIRLCERAANVGIQRNYYETFEQCRGKYIAWLDADDYWTDPEKLSIQTAVLEDDPSVTVCCHYVRWITNEGEVKRQKYPSQPAGAYGLEGILRSNLVPSPSAMFRNGLQRQLPAWYFDLAPTTDWPLWVLAALSGKILLLDRVMADYVLTPGSSLMGQGDLHWYKTDARFYEHIESVIPRNWHRLVRSEKGKRYEGLAHWLRTQGDFAASRKAALRAFCSPFFMDRLRSKSVSLAGSLLREAEWRITTRRTTPDGQSS